MIRTTIDLHETQSLFTLDYSLDQISTLLAYIGVHQKLITMVAYREKQTALQALKSCHEKVTNSFQKRRILIAIDVIKFIITWEANVRREKNASMEAQKSGPFGSVITDLRKSVASLRSQIYEKDERIFMLSAELDRLRKKLETVGFSKSNSPPLRDFGKTLKYRNTVLFHLFDCPREVLNFQTIMMYYRRP